MCSPNGLVESPGIITLVDNEYKSFILNISHHLNRFTNSDIMLTHGWQNPINLIIFNLHGPANYCEMVNGKQAPFSQIKF